MGWRDLFRRDAVPDVANRVGDALAELAAGADTDAKRTAAVSAAAGFLSRAFMGLTPSADDPRVTPAYLAAVGHELVLSGASYRLVADEALVTVADVEIGTDDRLRVFYRLRPKYPGREPEVARTVPARRVVAIEVPGMGVTGSRSHTLAALALTEARLERDAALPSLALQVREGVAQGIGSTAYLKAAEAVSKLLRRKGGATLAPVPPGHELAPLDATPGRLMEVRAALETASLAALGVPPSLVGTGNGAAHREDYRRTVRASIAPLAKLAAAELGRKLGLPDFRLSTAALGGVDVAAVARAVRMLKEAGMSTEDALAAAGGFG